jgi:soluble lytic murein transglycosylase-like protein
LSASLSLAACASNTHMAAGPVSSFSAADPALPDTVSLVPSASGVSGDEADGLRSLAHEIEEGATSKPVLRKKQITSADEAAPQAVVQTTIVANNAFPATPEQPEAAVASLAAAEKPAEPVAAMDGLSSAETPKQLAMAASPAQTEPLAVRGVAPTKPAPDGRVTQAGSVAARSAELDRLIAHYAEYYGVPETLVRRVAKRESTFNPRATNGKYLGLMQISVPTARGMGYRGGREGLLDAETNLKYAVRYLRGAFIVAGGNHDKADRLYQSGYYYHAKRAGLLDETGVGVDRKRRRNGSI